MIEAMKSNAFNFSGAVRSYWDFYTGYGLEAGAVCLVEAVIMWQLATIAAVQPTLIRTVVATLMLANIAHVALIARYFFYLPIVFDVAIAACLAWACVSAAS